MRGEILALQTSAGNTLCALGGAVWITEENNVRDVVLAPGQCFRLTRPGLTVIEAFDDVSLTFTFEKA